MLYAFDPGPHTGLAIFRNEQLVHFATIAAEDTQASRLEQMRDIRAAMEVYESTVTRWDSRTFQTDRPHVVIEDYRTQRTLTRDGALTLHLIGWLQGECLLRGMHVTLRLPTMRTTYMVEAVKLGPTSNHERDAIAHGLAYLATQQGEN